MGTFTNSEMEKEPLTLLTSTQVVINHALKRLGYSEEVYHLLKEPIRVLTVRIPVRMDDGSTKVFTGYRAQHNDAIGPTKGGLRFHPNLNEDDVKAQSMWMSIKCGIANLPFGGAKGGVCCNPRTMSMGELERLSRGYVRAVSQVVGSTKDIPGPGIYTNSQIMSWMFDEYSKLRQFDSPGFITGKPLALRGSEGRETAGAQGVAICMEEAAKKYGLSIKGALVIIQGFGNVGSFLAGFIQEAGATVVGISDVYGALYDPDGLNIDYLLRRRDSFGTISTLFEGTISNKELLEQDCDILVPSAVSNQITEENASNIRAKIVVEAASGAITLEAAKILNERGILLVPDVLASSGAVIVSYFEWVQNNQGYFWSEEEINQKMREKMETSFHSIYDLALEHNVDLRLAAYMAGIKKMADTVQSRGWI